MKTLGIVLIIVLALNVTALLMNLLFANTITGSITILSLIITGIWIAQRIIRKL